MRYTVVNSTGRVSHYRNFTNKDMRTMKALSCLLCPDHLAVFTNSASMWMRTAPSVWTEPDENRKTKTKNRNIKSRTQMTMWFLSWFSVLSFLNFLNTRHYTPLTHPPTPRTPPPGETEGEKMWRKRGSQTDGWRRRRWWRCCLQVDAYWHAVGGAGTVRSLSKDLWRRLNFWKSLPFSRKSTQTNLVVN